MRETFDIAVKIISIIELKIIKRDQFFDQKKSQVNQLKEELLLTLWHNATNKKPGKFLKKILHEKYGECI